MRLTPLPLVLLLVLAGCTDGMPERRSSTPAVSSGAAVTTPAVPSTTPTGTSRPSSEPVVARTLASGLEVPWGLAFLPDGSALVAERVSARVSRLEPTGAHRVVATVPGVVPAGEGGLLGLAVSPTYARDLWVYAYLTSATDNRVVRFRLAAPDRREVVVSGIPKAGNHDGGRLAFGPDGMLYAGTGDAGQPARAQSTRSLAGKILRLRPSGGPAPGNPFGNEVWSLGHRNVQGLAFDDAGRLWASELGQNTWDEVNLVERGKNYGWPVVEGRGTGGGRFVSPQVVWPTDDASPSGVAYAAGTLYVGALRGQRLWLVPLSGASAGRPVARYRGTYGRIRTVVLEPGGRALWLTTSNCDGRGRCGADQDRVLRVPL